MKIYIGNKCYTEYSDFVPHETCSKSCDICYLWHQGWSVRRFKILFITLLEWEYPAMARNNYLKKQNEN
jgi:hypothetical protein